MPTIRGFAGFSKSKKLVCYLFAKCATWCVTFGNYSTTDFILKISKNEMRIFMSYRYYFKMFKNEPDVLTVPDVVRLLQFGKNTVYSLIKEGRINSIKQGKKIIVPKVCLVEFLTDDANFQTPSPTVPNNLWTYEDGCDSVGVARETQRELQKKGA